TAEPFADRRGEWSLQAELVILERFEGIVGQVKLALLGFVQRTNLRVGYFGAVELAGHVAGMDVEPDDPPLAAKGLLHCGVENLDGASSDSRHAAHIHAYAIAAKQAHDRIVGNDPFAFRVNRNTSAFFGRGELVVNRAGHGNALHEWKRSGDAIK